MTLAELLADVSSEELARMARDCAHVEQSLGGPQLRSALEGVLRSHRFLQDFVVNRQPPTFAILTLLLEAADYELSWVELLAVAQAETTRISAGVDAGLIVGRDDHLRVYRRVLHQARVNDYQIDSIEASLLTVLRHELGIAQVEHFLIEHHADLREIWRTQDSFQRELEALRVAGILFVKNERVLLPSDQVTSLRRILGIDMPRNATERLFGYLSNSELHDTLSAVGLATSGNKDDRIARLITNMVQPRSILSLRVIGIDRLREVCRTIGAAVSGSKDDVLNRLVEYVSADRDITPELEAPAPVREERRLDREQFGRLFDVLKGRELTSLLVDFELKLSGTKEARIHTLWNAERSELTLLSSMKSEDLESLLRRLDLNHHGSKIERIERLLVHFSSSQP